jgi:hypothetical protein
MSISLLIKKGIKEVKYHGFPCLASPEVLLDLATHNGYTLIMKLTGLETGSFDQRRAR